MNILLVNPAQRRTGGYHNCGTAMPQLGLQVLAESTPDWCQVDILDETFGHADTEELIHRDRYDLVGVTAYTSGATRAYEIAQLCRERGVPGIMGGPHVWACPEEAGQYFESIAVGECDEIWEVIVRDSKKGALKRRYDGRLTELEKGYGRARQNQQPLNGKYTINCIQTSRGCPVGCDYCSVTRFNGPKIRRRSYDAILEEWNSTQAKFLFVVDDNFFGITPRQMEWSKELLRQIIQRGKKRYWFSQTTINMGEDQEGLELAYKAGCRSMLVGFESFNPKTIKECHKQLNHRYINRYKEMVDGFHKAGIAVFGAFIIGADHDTEETVSETLLQASRLGVDIIQLTTMTPLPGTKMYEQFMAEGRIFATDYPADWERYTFTETVYHPKQISAEQLSRSMHEMVQTVARENWVWKRSLKTLWRTRSLSTAIFVQTSNMKFARLVKSLVPLNAQRFGSTMIDNHRTEKMRRAMTFRCGVYQEIGV